MAEKINFKSIPDKIIATDQYDFIISNDNNAQNKDANKNSNLISLKKIYYKLMQEWKNGIIWLSILMNLKQKISVN